MQELCHDPLPVRGPDGPLFLTKCQFSESKRQPCLKPSDIHLKSAIQLGIFKMPHSDIQTFISWFQLHQGYIDTSALDIIDFPSSEGGRGAVALKDLPVSIRRSRHYIHLCRTNSIAKGRKDTSCSRSRVRWC